MRIHPGSVDELLDSGDLARAEARARDSETTPPTGRWRDWSTWRLVCEEILDTQQEPGWFDDIWAELRLRGFPSTTIRDMRRFAWLTAGWLNYDKMLSDWVQLDERDIQHALDLLVKERRITRTAFDNGVAFVAAPASVRSDWPT